MVSTSEASDQERETIKKEMAAGGEQEIQPPQNERRGKRSDVTSAPRDGEAKDDSQKLQEQITSAPRDGADKEDSTSGIA